MDTKEITNNEQAWEFIHRSLISQGEKSITGPGLAGACRYRYSDDDESDALKCAAGWLINDNEYEPEIEGMKSTDEEVMNIIMESHPNWGMDNSSEFIINLAQKIHDDMPVEDWDIAFNGFGSILFEGLELIDKSEKDFIVAYDKESLHRLWFSDPPLEQFVAVIKSIVRTSKRHMEG